MRGGVCTVPTWQEWVIWVPGDIWGLPTDTAKVVCSQQHTPGQAFPVQVTFIPYSVVLPMPEMASALGTAREPVLGKNKKDNLLWIPVPFGNLQLPVLTKPQLPSVCTSLELQPGAQKIPEAFGVGTPSFCGNLDLLHDPSQALSN